MRGDNVKKKIPHMQAEHSTMSSDNTFDTVVVVVAVVGVKKLTVVKSQRVGCFVVGEKCRSHKHHT